MSFTTGTKKKYNHNITITRWEERVVNLSTNRSTRFKNKLSSNRENIELSLLILPYVLLLILFCYLPMVGSVIAFKKYNPNLGIWGSEWVGFDNFKFFFTSIDALRIFRNTILYGIAFQLIGVVLQVGLAILMYNVNSRPALKYYQTTIILPNFLSWVLVAFIAYAILNPVSGYLNKMLVRFGMEGKDWYADTKYWPFILIIAENWKYVGMNALMYYAALMGIDESLFEAAKLDGANKSQIIRYIMIPEITSVISILLILGVGQLVSGDFGLFYQIPMNIGSLYPVTDVISTYIFRGLSQSGSMGQTAAVGLFQSLTTLILTVLSNEAVKRIDYDSRLF